MDDKTVRLEIYWLIVELEKIGVEADHTRKWRAFTCSNCSGAAFVPGFEDVFKACDCFNGYRTNHGFMQIPTDKRDAVRRMVDRVHCLLRTLTHGNSPTRRGLREYKKAKAAE